MNFIDTVPYNEKINVDLLMNVWVLFGRGVYNYI